MAGRFLFQKLSSRISSRSLREGGGSGTLSSFLHGSAAHSSMPIPSNNRVIHHRCAARYFNTLPWTSSAAKTTSRPTNGMASAVAHPAKPAFVDSARVKLTFSPSSPTKDAAWEATKKAIDDNFKASKTKLDKDVAKLKSFVARIALVWTLVAIGFIVESHRRFYVKGKSSEVAANDNAVVPGPSPS